MSNIPDEIHQQIENKFIDYEDHDKSAYVRGCEIYAANFGYRLALPKIEELEKKIEKLEYQIKHAEPNVIFSPDDKLEEQAKEIERLKEEIEMLSKERADMHFDLEEVYELVKKYQ
jgi:chromosome segregation ATPase